jgi:hypothetical protein|nr:MAG TPA: PROTEIN/RNA Complex, archaeal, ribosomal, 50S, protein.0A [Caudoviricetes sp.]
MNTCRRCGDELPPPHNLCEDCAYDMQNELDDWAYTPSASPTERTTDHGINRDL